MTLPFRILVACVCLVALGTACGRGGDAPPADPAAGEPTAGLSGAEAPDEPAAAAEPAPAAPAEPRPIPDARTREHLAAWWLRHDQSYMIVLDSLGDDGAVAARYLNPEPINVSRAETWIEDGTVRLLVELTDRGYPGSYYELAYLPDRDMWIGLYHHLGNGQTYEVYFQRFDDARTAPTGTGDRERRQ